MPWPIFEKLTKSATAFLSRWNGSRVRVRELTVSHRTLWIVLFRDRGSMHRENLVLSADPLWMSGPFEWSPANLRVDVVPAEETSAAAFTSRVDLVRVQDPIGFEFVCEQLEVRENVKLH